MADDRTERFWRVLQEARRGATLTKDELMLLLKAEGEERSLLYAAARELRKKYFDDQVYAYGFVYFSTYCRNNCTFCLYRHGNSEGPRYRKPLEEILRISRELAASGVHLLDLTMGEDPQYVNSAEGRRRLLEIARAIREENGLPVMFSPGVLPAETIRVAGEMGVEFYALYQETHNQRLFAKLRAGQSYQARLEAKLTAQEAGMLVEEGILAGVGESLSDIADSIRAMMELGAAQVRIMSFVPQKGAPLSGTAGCENLYTRELNTIATMRVAMPDRLIPASLDVAGKAGLRERLDAGANVVTSLIAPHSGLAGVSNATLDVENGGRSIPGILDTLEQCGLRLATHEEFARAIQNLRAECVHEQASHHRRASSGS